MALLWTNDFRPTVCGTACGTLPTKTEPACRKQTNVNITMLYFSLQPFTNDPTTANALWLTEFSTRLSNSTTIVSALRFKEVNAQLPDATPDLVKNEFGQSFVKKTSRQITFIDSEDSDVNYDWHRAINCGSVPRWWYVINDRFYGGKNGIMGGFISTFSNKDSSDSLANSWNCQISWDEIGQVERIAVPA